MIVLKVNTSEKGGVSDVTVQALEAEIKRVYEEDDAKALIIKFHNMMIGSTVSMVGSDITIYPHDIAAIFGLLKIPVKFVDDKCSDIAIDEIHSGVKWHQQKDE
jgi:hypothetical protein